MFFRLVADHDARPGVVRLRCPRCGTEQHHPSGQLRIVCPACGTQGHLRDVGTAMPSVPPAPETVDACRSPAR